MTTSDADLDGLVSVNGRSPAQYRDGPAGLVHYKSPDDCKRLANFSARIVRDTVWDDGSGEVKRTFTLEAQVASGPRHQLEVSATAFPAMSWVAELGAGAYLEPGPTVKDRARHAIQVLSAAGVAQRRVFAHSGWREIDGEYVWLHAGGAIGRNGPIEGVEVLLPRELEPMRLPSPSSGEQLCLDIRSTLEVLDVAPYRVTVPLLGATYRAPLRGVDFTVHLVGATGVYKSELSALCQQHFGSGFDARHLPGSWSSTANSVEVLAFTAKDALLVVDDFAPGGSRTDVTRQHGAADRLLRAQGNRSARGRLRPDGTMRAPKPPRGLILSTGEDIPRGQSLRSRIVALDLRRGEVDSSALSRAQQLAAEGVYARVMAAYLSWLARRPAHEMREVGRARERELRDVLAGLSHARVPDNIAKLAAGIETFLAFAVEHGAIDSTTELWQRCWTALLRVAGAQAEHQAAADPAARFLHLLSGAITSGRAHLDGPDGREPANAAAWGWRQDASDRWTAPPSSARIGWADGDDVYLDREASYAAAQRAAEDAGQALPVEQLTLQRRLREGGWLVLGGEPGRLTVRRKLGGVTNRRVLHLRADALLDPPFPLAHQPGALDASGTTPTFTGGFAAEQVPSLAIQPGDPHLQPGAGSRSTPSHESRLDTHNRRRGGRFDDLASGAPSWDGDT